MVDGRNGLIVPERDPDALARAITELAGDEEHARELGEQAREDVSDFDYPRMVEAFGSAVHHALNGTVSQPERGPRSSLASNGSGIG